jgi:hypothetical protein
MTPPVSPDFNFFMAEVEQEHPEYFADLPPLKIIAAANYPITGAENPRYWGQSRHRRIGRKRRS